jgi:hypothetical protein
VALAVLLFALVGCGGGCPGAVVREFYSLVGRQQYQAATEYLTAEARMMFGFAVALPEGLGEFADDQFGGERLKSVEIIRESVRGGDAEGDYVLHYADGSRSGKEPSTSRKRAEHGESH